MDMAGEMSEWRGRVWELIINVTSTLSLLHLPYLPSLFSLSPSLPLPLPFLHPTSLLPLLHSSVFSSLSPSSLHLPPSLILSSPVDDTLDSILAGSDDEAEEDAVISQVLDEIGIEVQQKLSGVGVASNPLPQQQRTKVGADTSDLEARLKQLQDP